MKKDIRTKIQVIIKEYVVKIREQNTNSVDNSVEDIATSIVDQLMTLIKGYKLTRVDMDVVKNELNKMLPDLIANNVYEKLDYHLTPYFELLFFQNLNAIKQKKLAERIYKNTIIIKNEDLSVIADETNIPYDNVLSCKKALNTIVSMVTIENDSETYATQEVEKLFGFSRELSQYLVSLIIPDKAELRMIMLLRSIDEIEDRIKPIDEFLHSILENDDNEKEKEQ